MQATISVGDAQPATFVDLYVDSKEAPKHKRLTAEELGLSPAAYERHVEVEDKIEAGTATLEDEAEAALREFCFANVADRRLVLQGEVWSDGTDHYFRADDFVEHLFARVPALRENWSVRYEDALFRKLACFKAKLTIPGAGSRERERSVAVYRTPWRGGLSGLRMAGDEDGCFWQFDPAAPWNDGLTDREVLKLEGIRGVLDRPWLSDDEIAVGLSLPKGATPEQIAAELNLPLPEKPKRMTAAPVKALPAPDPTPVESNGEAFAKRWAEITHPARLEEIKKKELRKHHARKARAGYDEDDDPTPAALL